MLNEEEIRTVVKQKIETDEKLGYRAGGSRHLGYTSYVLNEGLTKQLSETTIKITYQYTVFVETEFTVYPDNPAMEYTKTGELVIDKTKSFSLDE